MNHELRWAAPVLVLALVPLAAVAAAAPEPAPAASSLPPYSSAFADYKPWRDIQPGNWRALSAPARGDSMGAMPGMHDMGSPQSMAAQPGMPTASAPAGPAVPDAASTPAHAGHHGPGAGQ